MQSKHSDLKGSHLGTINHFGPCDCANGLGNVPALQRCIARLAKVSACMLFSTWKSGTFGTLPWIYSRIRPVPDPGIVDLDSAHFSLQRIPNETSVNKIIGFLWGCVLTNLGHHFREKGIIRRGTIFCKTRAPHTPARALVSVLNDVSQPQVGYRMSINQWNLLFYLCRSD